MAHTAQVQSIEREIATYVSSLSEKRKQAVLDVVKNLVEADRETEFEKKWAKAVPLDEAFQKVHDFISTLEWKK